MSTVRIEQLKAFLDITHNEDDAKLQEIIDGAEDEALQFLGLAELPRRSAPTARECDSNTPDPVSDSDDLAPAVRMGIYLLAQGMYEAKDAAEMDLVRQAAEVKLQPYRCGLGV